MVPDIVMPRIVTPMGASVGVLMGLSVRVLVGVSVGVLVGLSVGVLVGVTLADPVIPIVLVVLVVVLVDGPVDNGVVVDVTEHVVYYSV